jgi:hypothetical protein
MSSGRALLTAVLSAGLAGCPTETAPPAATTMATTTPTATTGAHAMAKHTPPPADALRPEDSDAFRLAASIVALGDGPWSPSVLLGQPAMDLTRHDLPAPAAKPATTTLVIPAAAKATLPQRFVGLGREVTMPVGELTLTFTMRDGSWEPSTGNAAPRMEEPVVVGITLKGPGGIPSPAPGDAVATEVMADDTGAATTTTTALVWGRSLSFQQGTIERPFVLTRFVGRAPFQYSPAEQRALEDALIAITMALSEPNAVRDVVAARFVDRRVSSDQSEDIYDFGAGTMTVRQQWLGVKFVGPMRLPRLFAAHGITMLKTEFVHNVGQMPVEIHGAGFDLYPGTSSFDGSGRRSGYEAEMGEAALARFTSLGIDVKPRQIGDVSSSAPPGR